jgi:hypothetical protein
MLGSVVRECNALGNIAFKDYVCRQSFAEDFEVGAVLICLKITSGRVTSLASIRARPRNQPYQLSASAHMGPNQSEFAPKVL